MANDIGLSVREGVSNGLTPFQEPSKRNIGIIMERLRGIENSPIFISSYAEDRLKFGGFDSNMFGPVVARNLFKNTKGSPVSVY